MVAKWTFNRIGDVGFRSLKLYLHTIFRQVAWLHKYAPVNYAFRFSGPVTALRARAGTRAKSKIDCPLKALNSQI